jgi:hypothetical protein
LVFFSITGGRRTKIEHEHDWGSGGGPETETVDRRYSSYRSLLIVAEQSIASSSGHVTQRKNGNPENELDGAKGHRLEAYATFFLGLSSDLSGPRRARE